MRREVVIRRLAETHLAEAYAWYERQAPGLGADFLNRYAAAQTHLADYPEAAPVVFLDYRRALIRRFPYGIFYIVDDNVVVIAAVYHLARNPQTIQAVLRP